MPIEDVPTTVDMPAQSATRPGVSKRRDLHLRRVVGTMLLVLFATVGTGFAPPALLESPQARTPLFQYQLELAGKTSEKPDIIAESAVIVDGATGKVVYAKNAHARMAPASTTKIMTAIVALENGRLDDLVQIDVNGYAMAGSSIMGITPGEVLTLEDLLYGLMLPSGNDAALAIARHIGGSETEFVRMMNEKAAQLGLKNTHFVNPHGLDDDKHYSSAYDLAMMGRYGMNNPVFARIVGTRAYTARGKATYHLVTGNRLLGQYEGADGVKTGYTEASGQSFVASVSRDGHRVLVSLIRSSDRARDARMLFDYFFENFRWVKLALPPAPFNALPDPEGGSRRLVTESNREEVLAHWEVPYLRDYIWLDSPENVSIGGPVGSASFYLGDSFLVELPAFAK